VQHHANYQEAQDIVHCKHHALRFLMYSAHVQAFQNSLCFKNATLFSIYVIIGHVLAGYFIWRVSMPLIDELFKLQGQEEKPASEDRLVMLCDGIFAIAITLLVLDIKVPLIPPQDLVNGKAQTDLHQNIVAILHQIIIYLITFFIVASYWNGHRR